MKIKDIIALTLAGYKKSDIDKLLALEVEEPEKKEEEETPIAVEDKPKEPDYKAMFEEMEIKLADTQKALEEAQHANVSHDVSKTEPIVSDIETLQNIFR